MDLHSQESNGFRVSIRGNGKPVRLFTGGLAYSPGDHAELAQELPGMNIIANNPLHTGEVAWDMDWLRTGYARLMEEKKCTQLITHSLGALDAIEICLQAEHPPESVVLFTPPLCSSYRERIKNIPRLQNGVSEQFGILDPVLSDLCTDMTEEQYLAFLKEHHALYGKRTKTNYKKGMPSPDEIPQLIEQMIKDINALTKIRMLAIVCSQDIWSPPEGEALPELGEHVTVVRMEGAHYPHRNKPKSVADCIRSWELKG